MRFEMDTVVSALLKGDVETVKSFCEENDLKYYLYDPHTKDPDEIFQAVFEACLGVRRSQLRQALMDHGAWDEPWADQYDQSLHHHILRGTESLLRHRFGRMSPSVILCHLRSIQREIKAWRSEGYWWRYRKIHGYYRTMDILGELGLINENIVVSNVIADLEPVSSMVAQYLINDKLLDLKKIQRLCKSKGKDWDTVLTHWLRYYRHTLDKEELVNVMEAFNIPFTGRVTDIPLLTELVPGKSYSLKDIMIHSGMFRGGDPKYYDNDFEEEEEEEVELEPYLQKKLIRCKGGNRTYWTRNVES